MSTQRQWVVEIQTITNRITTSRVKVSTIVQKGREEEEVQIQVVVWLVEERQEDHDQGRKRQMWPVAKWTGNNRLSQLCASYKDSHQYQRHRSS